MSAKSIMFMGTGSDVGKSLIVAGICRALNNRGLKIAPFKPQNMSNNSAVCCDGGEIGRAQALQARAARVEPINAMNPILLKPEHANRAQLILRGKRIVSLSAREYFAVRKKYLPDILASFAELKSEYDYILIEGAGSASEINLRANDLANFGFARAVNIPVVLIGDISRGGVIASILGTFSIIEKNDNNLIIGSIINKFLGDKALFAKGINIIKQTSKREVFGLVPHFEKANKLPSEDSLALEQKQKAKNNGQIFIAVPRLSRISNFDDLDPLMAEKGVFVKIIEPGKPIPQNADLIIIPGTKATIADMEYIYQQGWDIDIKAHVRANKPVLGICGGYQILGQEIEDNLGIEGKARHIKGLGLLEIKTSLTEKKSLYYEEAIHLASKKKISGYHMHMGESWGEDCKRPFAKIGIKKEGAISKNSLIMGTYLHGLFAQDEFRRWFLQFLGAKQNNRLNYEAEIEQILDELADHLETHLDIDAMMEKAR